MQSKNSKMLYDRLTAIASDIVTALDNKDFQALAGLSDNHSQVMKEIRQMGIHKDIHMKPALEKAEKQVQSVMTKIQTMQNEITDQLSAMNNKRLIKTAYDT